MKKIFHISDLHFGTEDKNLVKIVLDDIDNYSPNLVVISGDLTQRAKSKQYTDAAVFLSKIKFPKIVVPGNHDISLWNIFRRFFKPLKKFNKFIESDEFPIYSDNEMTIVGINSARSLTIKSGRISSHQINYIKKLFCDMNEPHFKGVVVHHNLIPFAGMKRHKMLGRSKKFIDELKNCGIDILFSGHLHQSYLGDVQKYFKSSSSIIFAQAGTATSKRIRGEQNNYNIIEVNADNIILKVMCFNGEKFIQEDKKEFERKNYLVKM